MSIVEELKRRNVFRVGIAYVLMGWVLLQAADFALDLIPKAVAEMVENENVRQIDFIWSEDFALSRNEPGFQALIDRSNLREVWDAFGPPPACRQLVDTYDCSIAVNSTP